MFKFNLSQIVLGLVLFAFVFSVVIIVVRVLGFPDVGESSILLFIRHDCHAVVVFDLFRSALGVNHSV